MNTSFPYIVVAIVALAVVTVLLVVLGKGRLKNRITPLAGFAFAFIVAGAVFGENSFIAYSLMGVGVLLALVDMFRRSRQA